jgi:hypothetical protein
MRLSKFLFYPAVFAPLLLLVSLFSSCKFPFVEENQELSVEESYKGKGQQTFNALKTINNAPYLVDAVRLADNDVCIVYGDYGAKVPLSTAEEIALEYKDRIHPSITGVFGDYYSGTKTDKRLIILLLDIVDGYDPKTNPTYVAGYFNRSDIFPKSLVPNSNEAPMLYMDVNPGKPGDYTFYTTIAHELQHLINFSSRYYRGKESEVENETLNTPIESMDEWVDEGLSSAAEYIYSKALGKGHIQDKIEYYNGAWYYFNKKQSNIPMGNNFFTWGENSTFLYDDYVTVYLFFQWLRIQAAAEGTDGASIYRSIVESEYTDYRAVTTAAREHIPGFFGKMDPTEDQTQEWELLLETWLAANYVNAPKKDETGGFFGYNGEIILKPVMLSGKPVLLYPGEGVYSKLDGRLFSYSDSPDHIRYTGLDKTGKTLTRITQENPGGGDALLTFNINHDVTMTASGVPTGPTEPGTLAGVEPVPTEPSPSGRAADMPAKPLPIDIRPPLRF